MAARHCMLAKHLIETVLDYSQLMFLLINIKISFSIMHPNLQAWVNYWILDVLRSSKETLISNISIVVLSCPSNYFVWFWTVC